MSAFTVQGGHVVMTGAHKPWRLSEAAVDGLLDIMEAEGAAEQFNDLCAAARQAYGPDYIERVTSLRLVVNNGPQDVVRGMLRASCNEIEDALAARQLESQP